MRITAAVLDELHAPFHVEDVEIGEPRAGEVLVRVTAAGVCHTDGVAQHGDLPFPAPGVLGHEGAGVVTAVGDGADEWREGDRVVIGWPWCGTCRNCLDGEPRYCLDIGRLIGSGGRADGSTGLSRTDGSPLHSHFFGQSSFATHALTYANQLVRVPDDFPLEHAGPLACGVGTGAGAVLNALRPEVGSSIAIFGVGSVGLAAVMAARLSGATTIVAVDRHESRLDLARQLGATETVNVGEADPVAAIREICSGPADYSLECTGSIAVCRQAADVVGLRGTCGLIGAAPANAEISLDHLTTLWGKNVRGILGGEGRSTVLLGALMTLHRQGRFPFERLITEFPLDQLNEALEASHGGDVLKPVLRMP